MPLPTDPARVFSLLAKETAPTCESCAPIWYAAPAAGAVPCHAPMNVSVCASFDLTTFVALPDLTRWPP
jgi:hypothetical protein